MSLSLAGWFIVLLALIGANLPFINHRLFGCWRLPRNLKPIGWRLAELIIFYFVIGLVSRALEARISNVFQQHWQFYMITASLFLVFAFPGFVYAYLFKRV